MHLPLSEPDIGEREIEYVTRVLRSQRLSLGPAVTQFEDRFAQYIGARHAIAVNSGTSALHLCVRAMGIRAGDAVITTSFSFVASVNCVLFEGASPILLDIEPRTLNLDPNQVRDFLRRECTRQAGGAVVQRATGKIIKAILPVHVFGLPCDMQAFTQLAREYNLLLLEDACEAIGAETGGRKAGTFGDAAVFAFYPNKQMTTGEGGMIVTDDLGIAEMCRSLRNQGRDANGAWLNHVQLGYNYRLSDIHAALGLAQLERIAELLAGRREAASMYSRLLESAELLELPHEQPGLKRSWFVYVIRFRGNSPRELRERVRQALLQQGITTQIYFPAIHRQPYFRAYQPQLLELPHTEQAADSCLALPFSSRLGEAEIHFVCDAIASALEESALPAPAAPQPHPLHAERAIDRCSNTTAPLA
ncbi:MAG: DegT/DnrJ/EryC1/StrS family aminotransferase [Candidatus Acidiferrales bacterium]